MFYRFTQCILETARKTEAKRWHPSLGSEKETEPIDSTESMSENAIYLKNAILSE